MVGVERDHISYTWHYRVSGKQSSERGDGQPRDNSTEILFTGT